MKRVQNGLRSRTQPVLDPVLNHLKEGNDYLEPWRTDKATTQMVSLK